MCGIAVSFGEKNDGVVKEMLSRMAHRGPDGRGVFRIGNSILGHLRLAIIDVQGGGQPLWNEQYDLAVTFNGEIYNHLSIRAALEDRHPFKTRSDTEVLVHGFEEEGSDILR
ncbi:MAG: asparagine synthetase B, partial [Spirochaetia bacterium]|nr:asparagine synthetase B [Spirochaetia bacterium]